MKLDMEDIKSKIDVVSAVISFSSVLEDQMWRIGAVKEVAQIKSKHLNLEGFTDNEVEEILRFLCVS